MTRGARTLFGTRHGLALLARNTAVPFGALAGAAQLYLALWPDSALPRGWSLLAIALVSLVAGVAVSWPRDRIERAFRHPDFTVALEIGDLFDQDAHLVIGFNDAFDTDTADEVLVARRSVQGQLLHRVYDGEVARLDAELTAALAGAEPSAREERAAKPLGKLDRYPIGTVAVLGGPARRYFCTAYGRLSNDYTVSSGVDALWGSLGRLWTAVHLGGRREAVAMPVVGSDLARIDTMDHGGLVKLILLSFVARSRQGVVCENLTIVVHPKDRDRVDMLELDAFLRSL
ncbi:macro domain-containing protein [Streptomyces sp. JNUCC 64]